MSSPNNLPAGAAAAKSLQSCPTLSDPMDCSLPGSSIHGIFQARVLEWGAIAFSNNLPVHPSSLEQWRVPGGGSRRETCLPLVLAGQKERQAERHTCPGDSLQLLATWRRRCWFNIGPADEENLDSGLNSSLSPIMKDQEWESVDKNSTY